MMTLIAHGRVETMTTLLPSFARPPVKETVLGVQFSPIPRLRNAHLGAFWKSLGAEWADVSDAPPVPPNREAFSPAALWRPPGLQLQMTQDPSMRTQARSASGDAMIQIQNGRLHFNWLGGDASHPYPRYPAVYERFDWLLDKFTQFLGAEGLAPPRFELWEVVYVNRIPRDGLWSSPADWSGVIPSLFGPASFGLGRRLESASGSWRVEIEPQRGRLYIEAVHVLGADAQEFLQLTLTARGDINADPGGKSGLVNGLNIGHEAIVLAFDAAASERAKAEWGRIE